MIAVPFTPMQPVRIPAPFDSPEYVFQVKWDGVRIVCACDGARVRLFNRHLQERTALFPELQRLVRLLDGRAAVVDGELIALHDGRPLFQRVMSRLSAKPERAAELVDRIPVHLMAFDLVALDGLDLTGEPLERRLDLLRVVLRPDERVHLVDSTPRDGVRLFEAVRRQGLEGIVAKRLGSRYVCGESDLWRKVKCVRRLRCVVVGYRTRGGRLASLLLGVYRDGALRYAGHAGAGLTDRQAEALMRVLPRLSVPRPQFAGRPGREPGAIDHFVRPALVAEVEYLEWTPDLRLRAPVLKGFPAGRAEDCRDPTRR